MRGRRRSRQEGKIHRYDRKIKRQRGEISVAKRMLFRRVRHGWVGGFARVFAQQLLPNPRCLGANMNENTPGGEESVFRDKSTADDEKHPASIAGSFCF